MCHYVLLCHLTSRSTPSLPMHRTELAMKRNGSDDSLTVDDDFCSSSKSANNDFTLSTDTSPPCSLRLLRESSAGEVPLTADADVDKMSEHNCDHVDKICTSAGSSSKSGRGTGNDGAAGSTNETVSTGRSDSTLTVAGNDALQYFDAVCCTSRSLIVRSNCSHMTHCVCSSHATILLLLLFFPLFSFLLLSFLLPSFLPPPLLLSFLLLSFFAVSCSKFFSNVSLLKFLISCLFSSFHPLLFTAFSIAGSNESHLGSIASYETRRELEKERDKDKDKPAGHMPREGSLRSVFSSSGVSLDSISNSSTTLQNTVVSPIVKNVLSGKSEDSYMSFTRYNMISNFFTA